MSLNSDHEALRDRLRYGRLTEDDRTTLANLLDQVRAATTLTEDAPLEEQSVGFWWGAMAQYRALVPAQREAAPARDDVAAIRADPTATAAELLVADAHDAAVGPERGGDR